MASAVVPVAPSTGVTPPTTSSASPRLIGDVVVDLGFADRARVEHAIAKARETGRRTGQVLVEDGVLTSDQLARVIADRFGVDHVDLSAFTVDMTAANLLASSAARRYEAVPVGFVDERTVLVAMCDPGNVLAVDDIALMTGFDVRPAATAREDVMALIGRLNQLDGVHLEDADEADDELDVGDLRESADDAPVIKLVHSIVGQGIEQGASDIHFEPSGGEILVRYRIDGVLSDATRIPRKMVAGIVSRIKIMAELDIAERRAPQDGRMSLGLDGRKVDIRVATLPLVGGEAAVLRILDKQGGVVDLDRLGFSLTARRTFEQAFNKPHGAVLVTGPTGSGKTTTLYGALQVLHTPEKNIITIEDPVEYGLTGIKQMQVNPRAGVTFEGGLRSMMRADPDVIMVGEIRDRETAQIAVEAALTGHLVLSTLHTNDAPTAIARLIDMGVEPFLVASAVDCVVAQRLARTLCLQCREPVRVSGEVLRANGFETDVEAVDAFEPVGCARCGGTGYKGRIGLYEVMPVDQELRQLAVARAASDEIAARAVAKGMVRLREDGMAKAMQGLTSFAEVARVTA
jgi:type IV pilus assembly protein PilB